MDPKEADTKKDSNKQKTNPVALGFHAGSIRTVEELREMWLNSSSQKKQSEWTSYFYPKTSRYMSYSFESQGI